MIDQSTIDRIFDTAKIEEVVGDYVTLKRRGANMIGHCPFHNEKTPSFSVLLPKIYINVLVVERVGIL